MTELKSKVKYWEILAVLLLALNFIPLMSAGFYGDDMTASDLPARIRYTGLDSMWYLKNDFQYNQIIVGRFDPLHTLQRHLVFAAFAENIWGYRLFMCVMNTLAVFCVAAMVKAFTRSRRYFCAVLVLLPSMFFQFTRIDDPVTSYYAFLQCLTIYLSLSLILLKKYAETGRRLYMCASVFLYVLSLLTFETSYPLWLCYPVAAYFLVGGEKRLGRALRSLKLSVPHLVAMLLSLAAYVWFAKNATSEYAGISAAFDIKIIAVTFAKQVISAFPLSAHAFRMLTPSTFFKINALDVVTVLVAGALFWTLPKDRHAPERRGLRAVGLIAALMVLLPCLPIAVSAKYQTALKWSLGYLPYYISRFGVLLLMFMLYELILRKCGKYGVVWRIFGVALVMFVQLATLSGNREVIESKNWTTNQRAIVESAADDGIFEKVEENSKLLCVSQWWSIADDERRSAVLSMFSGKRVKAYYLPEFLKIHGAGLNGAGCYFNYSTNNGKSGYVYVANIKEIRGEDGNWTVIADELTFFSYGGAYSAIEIPVDTGGGYSVESFELEQLKGHARLDLTGVELDISALSPVR